MCLTCHFKLGHFQNGLGQSMILKLCTTDIIKLTSPALPPSLFSPSWCFSSSTAIFFCVKNELSFCCCFIMNKGKEQKIQQMKCESISKATYAKPWNVHSSISLYNHISSHFFIKLKIYHHSSLFTNYHDFGNEMIPLGILGGKSGVVIVARAQDGLEVVCPYSLPLSERIQSHP